MERIGSKTVYEGKVASVRIDRFRYGDGSEAEREVVAHPGAVAVVAHDDVHIYLVRQPREAVGEEATLELPAGKLDVPGEAPLDCARRELAEEVGLQASEWTELKRFYTSPGFAEEQVTVYLATGLRWVEHRAGPRRAHRGRAVAARRPRRRDRRVRRREIADRDAGVARHAAVVRLHQQGARRRGRKPAAWRSPSRSPRYAAPMHASRPWCSTSSPTWSSSAAWPATRWTPTAPTCCSSAPSSPAAGGMPPTSSAPTSRTSWPTSRPASLRMRTATAVARRARRRRSAARPPACARSTATCGARSWCRRTRPRP